MMKRQFLWGVIASLILACGTTKSIVNEEQVAVTSVPEMEERTLDTLFVTPDLNTEQETFDHTLPQYRETTKRTIDLVHTKLDLRFDWNNETVIGKAILILKPYFYSTKSFSLDAKGFQINELVLLGNGPGITYQYDGMQINVILDQEIDREDTIELLIDYLAHPAEGEEGSLSISSDRGLFFINARGEDPSKPQQIWTQGETEFNSRWFPTVDKPNEKTTQEISLTVDEKFKTLSNGILKQSINNSDGTRTDHWVMDKPHAPYLCMIAIGDYALVEEKWKDIPVQYYVEHPYKDDAEEIFKHTPEMLTFFSNSSKGIPVSIKKSVMSGIFFRSSGFMICIGLVPITPIISSRP